MPRAPDPGRVIGRPRSARGGESARDAVAQAYRRLAREGLIRHASGNVSVRAGEGFLITPSGVPADDIDADGIVAVGFDGEPTSPGRPSSEWRFHRDIYLARPEIDAVVHTHSPAASALACLRQDMPAFHYMVAIAGGEDVRCADYALFGTQALSDRVVAALDRRKACLMANHGMVAIGATLAEAMMVAAEVEGLADLYGRTLAMGRPTLLSHDEMREALSAFEHYRRSPNDPRR